MLVVIVFVVVVVVIYFLWVGGGGIMWRWLVLIMKVMFGNFCGWGVVVGFICGCEWREKEVRKKEKEK